MAKQLTLYRPQVFAGLSLQELTQYPFLSQLIINSQVHSADKNTQEESLAQLALARALAKGQALNSDLVSFIVEPIKIHLDQTQGYLAPIAQSALSAELMSALNVFLQKQLAPKSHHLHYFEQQQFWLFIPKEKPLSSSVLLRSQASQGMAIQDFLPPIYPGSIGVWFNEMQIALHEFNQQHHSPINALWFWGNGLNDKPNYDCIITDNFFLKNFAKANGIACFDTWHKNIVNDYQAIWYMRDKPSIDALDEIVFKESLTALKRGELLQIKLDTYPFYQFNCDKTTLKKWWQRTKTVENILHDHH